GVRGHAGLLRRRRGGEEGRDPARPLDAVTADRRQAPVQPRRALLVGAAHHARVLLRRDAHVSLHQLDLALLDGRLGVEHRVAGQLDQVGRGFGVLQAQERLPAGPQDRAAHRPGEVGGGEVDVDQHPVAGRYAHAVVGEERGVALQKRFHGQPSPSWPAAPARATPNALVPSATSVPSASRTSVRTTTTLRPARATAAAASNTSPCAGARKSTRMSMVATPGTSSAGTRRAAAAPAAASTRAAIAPPCGMPRTTLPTCSGVSGSASVTLPSSGS